MGCVSRTWIGSVALFAVLGLGAEPTRADVSAYTLEKIILQGDADPVAGTLSQMSEDFDFDTSGRAVVESTDFVAVPYGTSKIFFIEDGGLTAEVAQDDPVPGTAGLTFLGFGSPRIAAPDTLAYVGVYTDAFGFHVGGFLRHDGVDSAIALPGASAPGGGTIDSVRIINVATAAPIVALGAEVDTGGPSPIAVHFVHDAAGLREIYREGQAAPAAVGGTFAVQSWWIPALQPDGTLIFYAEISGGSAASGLFEAAPNGVTTPVLLAGDAVTTPGGGQFDSFIYHLGANADGDLAFASFVMRPPLEFAQQSVFMLEAGVQREIAFGGDPILGTNPERFYGGFAGRGAPALNRAGHVAFASHLTDAVGSVFEFALLVDIGDGIEVLAKEGDPVPGVAGASFQRFLKVHMHDDGTIAFLAYTTAGTGVFRATLPAQVPAMPSLVLAILAGLLGIGGVWSQRRTN